MADPRKRDRPQEDEYNKADKRLRLTSDQVGKSSSPERNLEARHGKERGSDSPPSSNSLSSEVMKRLQPDPSALSSGNWCKNLHNVCPKLRTTSQSNVFFRKPSKTGNGVFEQQHYEQTSSAAGSRVFQFKLFHREAARRAAGSSGVPKLELSAATSEAATTSYSRVPKFKLSGFAAAAQAANSAAA